jgi:hypothetical protein
MTEMPKVGESVLTSKSGYGVITHVTDKSIVIGAGHVAIPVPVEKFRLFSAASNGAAHWIFDQHAFEVWRDALRDAGKRPA